LPGRKYLKKERSVLQKRKLKIQSNEIHEQKKKDPPEKNTLIHGHLYPPVARMIRLKKNV